MYQSSQRIKDFGIARKLWILAVHKPETENKKTNKQFRVVEDTTKLAALF